MIIIKNYLKKILLGVIVKLKSNWLNFLKKKKTCNYIKMNLIDYFVGAFIIFILYIYQYVYIFICVLYYVMFVIQNTEIILICFFEFLNSDYDNYSIFL